MVYDREECEEILRIMHDGWVRLGQPPMDGAGGASLHPSLEHVPELARFYGHAEVAEVLGAVLKDDVRLEYGGANIADETRSFFQWHTHEGGRDGVPREILWDPDRDDHYDSVKRINCNVYPDGSNHDKDPSHNNPDLEPLKSKYPVFRKLMERTTA